MTKWSARHWKALGRFGSKGAQHRREIAGTAPFRGDDVDEKRRRAPNRRAPPYTLAKNASLPCLHRSPSGTPGVGRHAQQRPDDDGGGSLECGGLPPLLCPGRFLDVAAAQAKAAMNRRTPNKRRATRGGGPLFVSRFRPGAYAARFRRQMPKPAAARPSLVGYALAYRRHFAGESPARGRYAEA